MKFRLYALLACAMVVGLSACSEDPTASKNGVPEAIVTTLSETHQIVGAQFSVAAYAVDKNVSRIPGKLNVTVASAAVSLDSVVYVSELAETRMFMTANTVSAAGAILTVEGHGLTRDVKVVISEPAAS